MGPVERFKQWREGRKQKALPPVPKPPRGELREFIYIDDVSVQSLLASRYGPVAVDFTDTGSDASKQTRGFDVGLKEAPLSLAYKTGGEQSSTQTAQVVRRSSEQARFKQLLDSEADELLLRPAETGPSTSAEQKTIDELLTAHPDYFLNEQQLRRGALVEVEVELEADPIYALSAALSSFISLFSKAPEVLPEADREGLAQSGAYAEMLDELLAGLVPVRGRMRHYRAAYRRAATYLVDERVAALMTPEERRALEPVYVVGVAERERFWKDIRRVLFAGHRYTVMARVASDGLLDDWQPIKLADLVRPVSPMMADVLSSASSDMLAAVGEGEEAPQLPESTRTSRAANYLRDDIAEQLGLTAAEAAEACAGVQLDEASGTGSFRTASAPVVTALEQRAGKGLDRQALSDLREAAWQQAESELPLEVTEQAEETGNRRKQTTESYLDVEFVAIYW